MISVQDEEILPDFGALRQLPHRPWAVSVTYSIARGAMFLLHDETESLLRGLLRWMPGLERIDSLPLLDFFQVPLNLTSAPL